MKKLIAAAWLATLSLGTAMPASAATWLVNGYANQNGGKNANNIFGSIDSPYSTNQFGFSSAMLAQSVGALPTGAVITGVALRQASATSTNSSAITFDQFDIQIGQSAVATGSLGKNFADNMASDTITARSGAMTIAARALGAGGSKPGAFYTFSFDTPYTYTGGDLLVTINSHLTSAIPPLYLDAYADTVTPTTNLNTVISYPGSSYLTSGRVNVIYRPVMELVYTLPAVPEPTTWATTILGFAILGMALRRDRRTRSPANA